MMEIMNHPRGLSVRTDDASFLRNLMRRLEAFSDGGDILLHKNQLVIPLRLAPEVIGLLHDSDVAWDPELRLDVERQMDQQRLQMRARLEVAEALDDPRSALAGFSLLPRLDTHQIAAVAAISAPSLRGLALFDEQGTGKTIVALASFGRLKDERKVERLLVVAPKSVLGVWKEDCQKLFSDKYDIRTAIGTPENRRRAIQSRHDILLVSYEAAVRELGLLRMVVAARRSAYMLVLDESYFVKNSEARRSKAMATLRPFCERAIALCGSPAPNSPLDIVNQVDLTDGGVAFAGRSISKDPEVAAQQVKKGLEQTIYLRRLKEDVLPDIPDKQFERIIIDLQPHQRKLYLQARDELVLQVKSIDEREFLRRLGTFFAKRSALLQICSNPRSVDPSYSETPAKLLALDHFLSDLIEHKNKKVVVWSFFRSSLQAISDRYRDYGLVRIDGSVTRIEDRIDAIDRFQNDDSIRLFVGNAAAAGAGITLTASHHAIYESFSNQAAHYMQSVDRIHRRGQSSDVTNYVLLARQTIEIDEFDRLQRKEENARDLLGDFSRPSITRTQFIEDLERIM